MRAIAIWVVAAALAACGGVAEPGDGVGVPATGGAAGEAPIASACEALCERVNECAGDSGGTCLDACRQSRAALTSCADEIDAHQRCLADSGVCVAGQLEDPETCAETSAALEACRVKPAACVLSNCDCGVDELGNQRYGWSCPVDDSCTQHESGNYCCAARCAPRPDYEHCGDRGAWSCHGSNPPDSLSCEFKASNVPSGGGTTVWCCG